MADPLTDEEIRDVRILLAVLRGPSPKQVGTIKEVTKRDKDHLISQVYERPVFAEEAEGKALEDFWKEHEKK